MMLIFVVCFCIHLLRPADQHLQHWNRLWWRHQIEWFSAFPALCEGSAPITGGFPSQRPVKRSFGVFFDLHFNKRLNKPSRHRWFDVTVMYFFSVDYLLLVQCQAITCTDDDLLTVAPLEIISTYLPWRQRMNHPYLNQNYSVITG